MTYVLQGVIGSTAAIRPCHALAHAVVADLGHGLGLMPMTDDLFDELSQGHDPDPRFVSCQRFPPGFDTMLAAWSTVDPVAYVEADYFGGVGSQFAAVWQHASLVLGPLHKTEDEPAPPPGMSPISQALRRLGVSAEGHHDEFAAVGLGRHRWTHHWLGTRP